MDHRIARYSKNYCYWLIYRASIYFQAYKLNIFCNPYRYREIFEHSAKIEFDVVSVEKDNNINKIVTQEEEDNYTNTLETQERKIDSQILY